MRLRVAITAALLISMAQCANAGEVLDRIIAVVDNTPVLLSDWDEALHCEALLAGRAPESFTEEERKAVFDRLVDQQLLREQMRGYVVTPIAEASLTDRVQETRKQLAPGENDAQWQERLSRSGITEEELGERIKSQMEIERFVEARFRPGLKIDDRSVGKYYRDQLLPELHKAGQKEMPVAEVADKIREVLVQQRIDEMLTSWLQTLREQAEIRFPSTQPPPSPAEVNPAK